MSSVAAAIEAGTISGCLWLYSNYHCNLACSYCLTESSPKAARRTLSADRMVELAREAAELGFRQVGVAGGEPFMLPDMPETLARLAEVLPVVVLTNATLFTDKLLERLRPLADAPVALQVSLDSADAELNDRYREPGNFATVVAAIPRLVELGIEVRIATTGGDEEPAARQRLCELHKRLGVQDELHVTRPIVHRGRAIDLRLGVPATDETLPPELTITADGAFWSPFAPTVHDGRLDIDLLITRVVQPLRRPAEELLALLQGRPAGADAALGIR